MIVRMKKVTMFCLESDRDATLERLRELGVLHVQPVQVREDADVEQARRKWEHVRRVLDVLPSHPHAPPSGKPAEEVIEAVWKLVHRRREVDEERDVLRHERLRIEPFGDFDPAGVRALAERGIHVRLFQADPRTPARFPDGVVVRELGRTKNAVSLAVIGQGEAEAENAREIRLPEASLRALGERLAALEAERRELDDTLDGFGGDYPLVALRNEEAEARVRFAEVRAGMGEVARVTYLQGYCPADKVDPIRAAAAEVGWGLRIEDPSEEDSVPTLLHNPRWVRPIKAVFQVIGVVPGYREVDISAVFLIFLSLFFAMLVGDAGYGAVFLGLTVWARRRFSDAPSYIFTLLTVTSVSTIVWGVLTGAYFGVTGLPGLVRWEWGWLTDPEHGQDRIIWFCFLIGAVQLTIAHAWNAWRTRNSWRMLAQLGWIGTTWTMYAAANAMVLGRSFPPFMLGVLGTGVLLIVLFMTPARKMKTEWMGHAMLPLNLVSNFVDVVSYIRLFAVGTATLAVAQAFNGMAIGDGISGWMHGLLAALVLLIGHTLNIVLAAMAVIVHGVRLNTLEFSGHLGMEWTGTPYRPFARRSNRIAEGPEGVS